MHPYRCPPPVAPEPPSIEDRVISCVILAVGLVGIGIGFSGGVIEPAIGLLMVIFVLRH